MARLQFGRLTEAWKGEASDFTPLLADQLDLLGAAMGVDLASVGESEVPIAGGRRIDVVATGADGSELVVENQYGTANHDHLTRGLAYAVARRARGLVVVAEKHRDEFRAVAQYLNEIAELDAERGIAVWLVEATAVRIDDSPWAPLFTVVAEPNAFTATVEGAKRREGRTGSVDDFLELATTLGVRNAIARVLEAWKHAGRRHRFGPDHVVLIARGPSVGGYRTVIAIYADGRVMVPFGSYAGQNSGIPIPSLTTEEFRGEADALFGFHGSERQARTAPGWLDEDRVAPLIEFCERINQAYTESVGG